jgi:hypothetical protein
MRQRGTVFGFLVAKLQQPDSADRAIKLSYSKRSASIGFNLDALIAGSLPKMN